MQFEQAVSIVTGGASGLGAAVARQVIDAGGKVAIADRDTAAGSALAEQLGEQAIFAETDVTDEAQVTALIDTTRAKFGAVNGLVCCAGIAPGEKVVGREGPHRLETFRRALEVNLLGSFNVARCAAAAMADQVPNAAGERGVIVFTASVAAFDGQIGQAAYSASKGGIVGMTLPIARELASSGIRVMTIAPGIFATPMLSGLPQPVQDSLGQMVPFPSRLGQPEEFARLVREIFENSMLNGEVIRLDGALRMAAK